MRVYFLSKVKWVFFRGGLFPGPERLNKTDSVKMQVFSQYFNRAAATTTSWTWNALYIKSQVLESLESSLDQDLTGLESFLELFFFALFRYLT